MNRLAKILFHIAHKNALKFPSLYKFIDWEKIKNFIVQEIANTHQMEKDPYNLLEALLMVNDSIFSAYDTNSNLRNLEVSLEKIAPKLSLRDIKEIKTKLSNLSNTSFWDTATELWFASELKEKNYNIRFDFPLRDSKKGMTPPNADIAIVGYDNKPKFLIDCLTPTLDCAEFNNLSLDDEVLFDDPDRAIDYCITMIKKKFKLKFLPNIDNYPDAYYGIAIALTKADDISAHLGTLRLLKKTPVIIDPIKYQFHPKLKFAIVGRFEENEHKIEFVPLVRL